MFAHWDSPGTYSIQQSQHEIVQRAKPMFAPGTVHYAVEQADIKEMDRLVKEGKDERGLPESVTLQEREELMGMMPVHVAAERGHEEVVQYLIKKHVDLDAGDRFRVTALHLAAIENRQGVVKQLIDAKASARQPDCEGDLPLHWAATKGHVAVMQALIKAGSTLDAPNKLGWTPLHRAAYNGRRQAVEVLVGAGASMTACNKDGNTPLHLAAFMNQLATIETLLGLSAPANSQNLQGQTPLQLCITDAARDILERNGGKLHVSPSTPAAPTPRAATTSVDEGLAEDIERLSTRPKDTALSQALRAKARADEVFPDVVASVAHGGGRSAADGPDESSLYMQPKAGGSAFLHEASQAFNDRASPYTRGYGTDNESSSRTSMQDRSSYNQHASSGIAARRDTAASNGGDRGSASERQSGGSRAFGRSTSNSHRQAASGASALAGRASNDAASSAASHAAGAMKSQLSSSAPGWDGVQRVSADEYQQKAKEENRKAAAAAGTVMLLGIGSSAGKAADGGAARPASGNKKFLEKYQLNKLGLFAPS